MVATHPSRVRVKWVTNSHGLRGDWITVSQSPARPARGGSAAAAGGIVTGTAAAASTALSTAMGTAAFRMRHSTRWRRIVLQRLPGASRLKYSPPLHGTADPAILLFRAAPPRHAGDAGDRTPACGAAPSRGIGRGEGQPGDARGRGLRPVRAADRVRLLGGGGTVPGEAHDGRRGGERDRHRLPARGPADRTRATADSGLVPRVRGLTARDLPTASRHESRGRRDGEVEEAPE